VAKPANTYDHTIQPDVDPLCNFIAARISIGLSLEVTRLSDADVGMLTENAFLMDKVVLESI
jgi:hypothetical protein